MSTRRRGTRKKVIGLPSGDQGGLTRVVERSVMRVADRRRRDGPDAALEIGGERAAVGETATDIDVPSWTVTSISAGRDAGASSERSDKTEHADGDSSVHACSLRNCRVFYARDLSITTHSICRERTRMSLRASCDDLDDFFAVKRPFSMKIVPVSTPAMAPPATNRPGTFVSTSPGRGPAVALA